MHTKEKTRSDSARGRIDTQLDLELKADHERGSSSVDARAKANVQAALQHAMEEQFDPDTWRGLVIDDDTGMVVLNEWHPETQEPNDGTRVIYGKRRSGKSWLVRWLLWLRQDVFKKGVCFSNTDELNKWYKNFMPPFTVTPYDKDRLFKYMEAQARVKKDPMYERWIENDERKYGKGKARFNKLFIVMDDVVADQYQFIADSTLNRAFVEGRHYDIDVYFSTQHVTAVPQRCRANTDILYAFYTSDQASIDRLYELGGDMWGIRPLFNYILSSHTENHSTLVFDKAASDTRALMERFYWYRAPDEKEHYKMGLIEKPDPKAKPTFKLCDGGLWTVLGEFG